MCFVSLSTNFYVFIPVRHLFATTVEGGPRKWTHVSWTHAWFIYNLNTVRLLSTFGIIIYTYTGYEIHGPIPLLFSSPCWFPWLSFLFIHFTYLETLLAVIGSCPLWSQVADKLSPQWVSQVNGEGVRCSLWAPQVKGPTPCSSGYIFPHTNPVCIVH